MFELVSFNLVTSMFVALLYVEFVNVKCVILVQEITYFMISNTVPTILSCQHLQRSEAPKEKHRYKDSLLFELISVLVVSLYLIHSFSLGSSVCVVLYQNDNYLTLRFPLLCLLLLSRQRFLRSEASKERTKIQIVPDN